MDNRAEKASHLPPVKAFATGQNQRSLVKTLLPLKLRPSCRGDVNGCEHLTFVGATQVLDRTSILRIQTRRFQPQLGLTAGRP